MTAISDITLTDEQRAQFERDGYFVARGLLAPQEAANIRATFMAQNAGGPIPGLSEIRGDYNPSDPLSFYPRMMHPHTHPELAVGPLSLQYMLDARFHPILNALMRDEPVAVQSMFYFKPPGARGQELHQDNYYLRVSPGVCMAAWIAVDDVDAENGGMKVVPGSQREEIACPEKADPATSFTSDYVPVPAGMQAAHCDMKAGDVLFFDGRLIHGSTPNTSADRFRCSLIFHYVPESSQEMSEGYHTRLTFHGRQVDHIAPAAGGGPCGVLQPLPLH
ncbi:protein involved in biosynthesis of mitomycin antibiotics/polyketide fumonisin [Capsulimonas corticalis]|uniref:Protein involved in biosynthesis of mitomycin antibiotics/polyketide fumonisin n=1 Tax=Capsulimonas corticalis TaxID=2219043 RepID=A0A402CUI2_9BACT|nr:phytanoyl-CoA dioxygenase family protein [Capsulimonas corticalis]BDI28998.1 protein involved in biosynthesis of mitomycin antibiotics/polyketide fumonisin [Capsulimonas corticalis]